MRLKVILTCSALLLMFGLRLAAVPNGDDVVGLEKKTWELWQKRDKAGFASLMDSDFINVDKHGVASKAQNVGEIDNLIKESYELSDFQIHQSIPTLSFLLIVRS